MRSHGGRLIGPNCLGIAVAGVSLNATFAARTPASGNIAFSSQSGALGVAFLEAAEARGLGLSAFVSIGNKADVSSNDLLEWWEDDPHTEVVLLYLESFGNPRRFGRLARRVARQKANLVPEERDDPVRATRRELTHGRARRLRSSRRRALPPGRRDSRDVARGADRRRGIAVEPAGEQGQARRHPDQRRWARDPVRGRLRRSRARASGVGGGDTRAARRAPLGRGEPCESRRHAWRRHGRHVRQGARRDARRSASRRADRALRAHGDRCRRRRRRRDRPCRGGVRRRKAGPRRRHDCLRDPAAAPSAVAGGSLPSPTRSQPHERSGGPRNAPTGYAVRTAPCRPSPASIARRPQNIVETALSRGDDVWLEAAEARALLLAYGIPLVPERIAGSAAEAAAAARELGFPVVVKTALAGAHKTDVGGLALDLGDDDRRPRRRRTDRRARSRSADGRGKRGAPGGDRPGPGLRSARRLRSRRRPRGAHRRGRVSDRAADRP